MSTTETSTTETSTKTNREALCITAGVTASIFGVALAIALLILIIMAFVRYPDAGVAVIVGAAAFMTTAILSGFFTIVSGTLAWAVIGRPIAKRCRARNPQPGHPPDSRETYYEIPKMLCLGSFIAAAVLGTAISVPITLNYQIDTIPTAMTISTALGVSTGIPAGIWAIVLDSQ